MLPKQTKYRIPLTNSVLGMTPAGIPTTLKIDVGRDSRTKKRVVYQTGQLLDYPIQATGYVEIDSINMGRATIHLFSEHSEGHSIKRSYPMSIMAGRLVPERILVEVGPPVGAE